MSTGAFTLADVDKPEATKGQFTAADLEPNHAQPDSFWRTVYDRSGLGAIQKLSGSLADWAQQHADTKAQENLHSVAQGGEGNAREAVSPRAGYDLLSHGARMISNAFDPKSVAATGAVALANTNPFTGIPVDAALVAHGGYGVAKNAKAAVGGNPDAVEAALLSGSEMAGGAAAAGAQAGALPKFATDTAQRMYQSALKPSTTLTPAERSGIIQTGLDKEIPVSEAGAEKLSALLQDLQAKTAATIAKNPNAPIDKFAVASRLNATAQRAANQVTPTADLNAIAKTGNEFLKTQPNTITADQAQALKQGTYQSLGNKAYGELKGATIEAQKSLARGLKEELQNIFPELKDLNAKQSELFDLQPQLERAIGRIDNHQLIGLGTPMATTAGAAMANSAKAGLAAGILKTVLDNPMLKSRLAIALNAAGKGRVSMSAVNAKIAAITSSLAANSSTEQPEP